MHSKCVQLHTTSRANSFPTYSLNLQPGILAITFFPSSFLDVLYIYVFRHFLLRLDIYLLDWWRLRKTKNANGKGKSLKGWVPIMFRFQYAFQHLPFDLNMYVVEKEESLKRELFLKSIWIILTSPSWSSSLVQLHPHCSFVGSLLGRKVRRMKIHSLMY